MNLSRESVYITPAVKCCAPDAPDAAAENIKPCKSHLLKEIEFIQPKIICTFGHLASMALLGIPLPIHRLRGRFHTFQGIRIMPTYSLGHLLKYPQDKRAAWEDIKLVMRESASSG
jgi:DNA polymerase